MRHTWGLCRIRNCRRRTGSHASEMLPPKLIASAELPSSSRLLARLQLTTPLTSGAGTGPGEVLSWAQTQMTGGAEISDNFAQSGLSDRGRWLASVGNGLPAGVIHHRIAGGAGSASGDCHMVVEP